jgi:hypothetical protein
MVHKNKQKAKSNANFILDSTNTKKVLKSSHYCTLSQKKWIIYLTLPILRIYCGWSVFSDSGESPVSSIQTYIGSAFSNYPVRWIETPETARSQYVLDKIAEKPVEKAVDTDQGKPQSASGDVLDVSPETQRALELSRTDTRIKLDNSESDTKNKETLKSSPGTTTALATSGELSPEEQQQVAELKAKDQEVRTHEMAHVAAGGQYVTSGPSYEYQIGPDGKGYAVGGSVGIDTSPVSGDPEATIAKMQTVTAAAMAPASPSGQDHKVAAAARQAEAKARAELAQSRLEQSEDNADTPEEQPEASAGAFTIVRSADKVAEDAPKSNSVSDAVMSSLVQTTPKASSEFAPSTAYKAQSTMSLTSPRFSAFA